MADRSDEGGDSACWAHELDDDGKIPDPEATERDVAEDESSGSAGS